MSGSSTALTIAGGRVIDPARKLDATEAIHIVGPSLAARGARDARTIDAAGLWVVPGFVDLRSVLRTSDDGAAALRAGVTTVVASPESSAGLSGPRIIRPAALTRGLSGEELGEVPPGTSVASQGFSPLPRAGVLRRALQYLGPLGVVAMVHPEDASLTGRGVLGDGSLATELGLIGVPVSAETAAIARDLAVLEDVGGRLHISHVSTARGVELISQAKGRGLKVTCDVSPSHLTCDVTLATGYAPEARVWPPLRLESDARALRAAVVSGAIDAIAFDHVRVDGLEREHPFEQCAPGTASYVWAVDALLGLGLPPVQLINALTSSPAAIAGLGQASLAAGAPADVVLVDPVERRVKLTVLGGEVVYTA